MIALKADRAGLQKLREWTLGIGFLAACLWVAANGLTRMSEARAIEAVQPRPVSAAEWMSWGVQKALEDDDGET